MIIGRNKCFVSHPVACFYRFHCNLRELMPPLLKKNFCIDCRRQLIMESMSFRKFLVGCSQNLENESIPLGTTGAVEGKKV